MMKIYLTLLLLGSTTLMLSCSSDWFSKLQWFSKNSQLKDYEDKQSYNTGYLIGSNLKKMQKNLKTQAFLQGIEDSLNNKESRITQDDQLDIQKQQLSQIKKEGVKHMAEGKQFLEQNKNQPGVTVTPSGLQYKILKEGTGKRPLATSTVDVHYRGTLLDGTEFDSSYKRNKSISFALNQVIKGWTEGVQLMKEGAKYKFFIPSELAYGSGGGGSIPPNATLIFEVELLKVL